MDEFITQSTSGRVYYEILKWTSLLQGPQVDEFIARSSNGQIHYKVHKWTSHILSPQKGQIMSKVDGFAPTCH